MHSLQRYSIMLSKDNIGMELIWKTSSQTVAYLNMEQTRSNIINRCLMETQIWFDATTVILF